MENIRSKSGYWKTLNIMVFIIIPFIFILGFSIGANQNIKTTLDSSSWASWTAALATVAIALLTGLLAKETWALRNIQLNQIEQIRKGAIKPSVGVYLRPSPHSIQFLDLIIKNNGKGTAQNVKFKIVNLNRRNKEGYELIKDKLIKFNIIKNGISTLGANEDRLTLFASYSEMSSEIGKEKTSSIKFKIEVSFKDVEDKGYKDKFVFDFSEYSDMVKIGGKEPIYKISDELEKISKTLNNYTGFKKLKVDTYNSNDRKEESERIKKEMNKRKKEGLKS